MEIITPKLKRGFKGSGTYRIDFDDKWFYIGSTKNLKRRFTRWRCVLQSDKFSYNLNIKSILPNVSVIKFTILEVIIGDTKEIEASLIAKFWDNPLLLNRCPNTDGSGVRGIRPYFGYVKPKRKPRTGYTSPPQRIARFDKYGNLLEIHPSKSHLKNKFPNCTHNRVNQYLRGLRGSVCGFKFKDVSDDGLFLEPIKFIPKSRKGINRVPKFYQLNSDGVIVGEFFNIKVAADLIGGSRSHLSGVLNKIRYDKTVKGYSYMYAEEYHKKYG